MPNGEVVIHCDKCAKMTNHRDRGGKGHMICYVCEPVKGSDTAHTIIVFAFAVLIFVVIMGAAGAFN